MLYVTTLQQASVTTKLPTSRTVWNTNHQHHLLFPETFSALTQLGDETSIPETLYSVSRMEYLPSLKGVFGSLDGSIFPSGRWQQTATSIKGFSRGTWPTIPKGPSFVNQGRRPPSQVPLPCNRQSLMYLCVYPYRGPGPISTWKRDQSHLCLRDDLR